MIEERVINTHTHRISKIRRWWAGSSKLRKLLEISLYGWHCTHWNLQLHEVDLSHIRLCGCQQLPRITSRPLNNSGNTRLQQHKQHFFGFNSNNRSSTGRTTWLQQQILASTAITHINIRHWQPTSSTDVNIQQDNYTITLWKPSSRSDKIDQSNNNSTNEQFHWLYNFFFHLYIYLSFFLFFFFFLYHFTVIIIISLSIYKYSILFNILIN